MRCADIADLHVFRVQDLEIAGADDALDLEWAAEVRRILLTRDVATMTWYVRVCRSLLRRITQPIDGACPSSVASSSVPRTTDRRGESS